MSASQQALLSYSGWTPSTLLNNLVAFYKWNDATDATGGTALTNTGSVAFNTGLVWNAFDFWASNTTKNLNRTPAILSYTDVWTAWAMSFWFNITTAWGTNRLVRFILNNGSLERNFVIDVATDSKPTFVTFDSTARAITATVAIATSTWTHCIATYDGTQQILYINDASVGTPLTFSWAWFSRNTLSNFSIGAEQTTNGWALAVNFSGLIDCFWVWNRALTSTERTALYNSGSWREHPF